MKTYEEAINFGKRWGWTIKWVVRNEHGCIVGGYKTEKDAKEGCERFNRGKMYGKCHVEKIPEKA